MPTEPDLLQEVLTLRARLDRLERQRRRVTRAVVFAAGLALLTGGLAYAADGNCPNGLPFCFVADTPVLAAEVNQNFDQLKEWIEQKVGPVGSAATLNLATPITSTQLAPGAVNSVAVAVNAIAGGNVADGTLSYADLNSDFACPSTTARATYGFCLFKTSGTVTYAQAGQACKTQRAHLCSAAELGSAFANGLNDCAFGWMADQPNQSTSAYAGYPTDGSNVPGCGPFGVRQQLFAQSGPLAFGWCCKQ